MEQTAIDYATFNIMKRCALHWIHVAKSRNEIRMAIAKRIIERRDQKRASGSLTSLSSSRLVSSNLVLSTSLVSMTSGSQDMRRSLYGSKMMDLQTAYFQTWKSKFSERLFATKRRMILADSWNAQRSKRRLFHRWLVRFADS